MKKVLSLVLALTMIFAFTTVFTGCGGSDGGDEGNADQAMKAGKRILLCCEDPMGRALLDRIFDTYGVPLAREVSFEGRAGDGSDDIWSLADEDPAKSVLLIMFERIFCGISIFFISLNLGISG